MGKDKNKDYNKKRLSRKKKIIAGTVAVVTAIGANAMIDKAPTYDDFSSQPTVVQTIDTDVPMDATLPDDDEDQVNEKRRSTIAKVIFAPLYAFGYGIIKLLELLLGGVLSPFLTAILRIVVLIGVVIGVAAICLKVAFPDVPLNKLLTKRRVISMAVITGALGVACEIVPLLVPAAARIVAWIRAIGGLLITGGMTYSIAKIRRRFQEKKRKLQFKEA